jgi:acyl dehydratase
MADRVLTLDEYLARVGSPLGVSRWIELDQARIQAFADATMDWQDIHVDVEAARHSAFGGTIAHGFLTLSLLATMLYEVKPDIEGVSVSVNYGIDKLRFIAPVPAGRRIRGHFVLKAAALRGTDSLQSTYAVTVEIEGENKPALVVDWIGLLYFAPRN